MTDLSKASPRLNSPSIERVALSELHTDPQNARRHGSENLKAICDSLSAYGQVEPLVVQASTGKVIGGNGRLEAMQELGWQDALVAKVDFDDPKAMACAIALNRTAELAEWDVGALLEHTDELAEMGFDLADTGFSDDVLRSMARAHETQNLEEQTPDEDLDDVPEPPKEAITRPGDIWVLGRHRLICADSRLLDDLQRLCDGQKMDAVVTDPPYGVDVVGGFRELSPQERRARGKKVIQNDGKDSLDDLLALSLGNAFMVCRDGAVWYIWAPAIANMFMAFAKPLLEMEIWRHTIIWVKNSFVLGRSDFHYRHEHCFYGWKPGAAHTAPPGRAQDTVWEIDRPSRSADHPTMKPVELMARCIRNCTHKGDRVLEPFAGSGTTLVACESLSRACYASEIDPVYCDVIIKRWEQLTGLQAERLKQGAELS